MGVYRISYSPYRVRAIKKKLERMQAAGICEGVKKRNSPVRAWGETETRFPYGRRVKFVKFRYGQGKHYNTVHGSMRTKARRRSRYSNYDNITNSVQVYSAMFGDILDRNNTKQDYGVTRRHFGVLSAGLDHGSPSVMNVALDHVSPNWRDNVKKFLED